MLMEADLPNDVEALRTLVLEQARELDALKVFQAEVERLKAIIDACNATASVADPNSLMPTSSNSLWKTSRRHWLRPSMPATMRSGRRQIGRARPTVDRCQPTSSGSNRLSASRTRFAPAAVAPSTRSARTSPSASTSCRPHSASLSRAAPDTAAVRARARSCRPLRQVRIVEGGIPTEALIAQVLVSKYADHLPLYPQAQIYARQGVQLDRSTLADWVGRAAWYLRPLRDHVLERLRRSERLFADETTAPVLNPATGRTKTGQLWAYARDDRPWGGDDPPMVAYVYAADRKSERAEAHLGDFAGILQVDGYGGYAALAKRRQQIQLTFCWAHVRRKFYELADNSPVATEVLRRIAGLYVIEDEVRGTSAEQRRQVRAERSRVIVDDLRHYLEARSHQVSAKSKLGEAIRYALTRWDGLSRFLDDARIDLDNNTIERSIRPLALNRKDALFAGSDEGGDNWAVIATLIENCKISGINPHIWLTETLGKLAAGHPANAVGELMSWTAVA